MGADTESAKKTTANEDIAAAKNGAIVELLGVVKEYQLGKVTVPAVRGVDISIRSGEFITVAGPSGSGKTTLLNLIGCVDTATRGEVLVAGKDTGKLSERELTRLRLFTIGFIFQSFNLISVLTAYQNIEFPLLLQKSVGKSERQDRVLELLAAVGLKDHARHRPSELSGGQRQRVAVARALVTQPKLVLADEPTANLDTETGNAIIDLMKELNERQGTTFVFSTHDHEVMRRAQRVIKLVDGRVVDRGDAAA